MFHRNNIIIRKSYSSLTLRYKIFIRNYILKEENTKTCKINKEIQMK